MAHDLRPAARERQRRFQAERRAMKQKAKSQRSEHSYTLFIENLARQYPLLVHHIQQPYFRKWWRERTGQDPNDWQLTDIPAAVRQIHSLLAPSS